MINPADHVLFRILGPLEAWTGQEWAQISAPKWRAVLAALLLNAGQPVTTGQLIAEVWGEDPPATAANSVSVYVLRLRRLIGDLDASLLVTRTHGYQAVLPPGAVDADRFDRLLAAGRRALASGQPERAAGLLAEALGWWRGRALADVPDTPLVAAEAARLEESRLEAVELAAEADLACGRCAQVVPELGRVLASHPLREKLWVLLMRALRGAGRQAEALEAYEQARKVIAAELGVDPSAELQQIHQQILNADASNAQTARRRANSAPVTGTPVTGTPVTATPGAAAPDTSGPVAPAPPSPRQTPLRQAQPQYLPPQQLPADIADFTGRAGEVERLRALLSEPGHPDRPGAVRVVLVVGTGGLGKTALAVHAAHRLAAQFPDGQLYASLLGATQPADPADILARFLRDLGMEPARIPPGEEERAAQYRTRLAGRRVLIVLDDARDGAQVRPLLPGSAACAVLVTARARLPALAGSRVIDLDVLPEGEARTLFGLVAGEDRAQAEPAATRQVLAACAGLPLAIRIAGARLAARGGWNVRYLADRLSDERRRLDELRVGNLEVRASFEVSFATLPAPGGQGAVDPARAFRLLGLWTGPFIGLPAAAALLGEPGDAVAPALDVLADAHLLESPAPDEYRFHDLLRVYAAERARTQESEDDRRSAITRLLTWYLHTTEAAARAISAQRRQVALGRPPPAVHPLAFASLDEALAWCEAERAALTAATELAAASGRHKIAWQLPAAAMMFFLRRSHWADWVATHNTGLASARTLGDRLGEAWMLNNLGMAYGVQRSEESIGCFQQALALYRELGDGQGETSAANNVANAWFSLGRFEEARDAATRSLEVQRRVGSRYGEGIALGILAASCRELGQLDGAVDELEQALSIFRDLDDQEGVADSLADLGETYLGLGRIDDAIVCLSESVVIRQAIGNRYGQAVTLRRLGQAHDLAGDHDRARELLTRALRIFEDLGDRVEAGEARRDLAEVGQAAG